MIFSSKRKFVGLDISKLFPVCFYEGEEGAAGGDSSPAPESGAGGTSIATADLMDGIPESVLDNDPEYRQLIEDEKNAGKKRSAENKSSADGVNEGDHIDEGPSGDSGASDEITEKAEGEADETNSGDDDDLSGVEFADDVIRGLKAEHLKTLPKEALAALADFHGEHTALSEEAKQTKESLEKLLEDPIIKRRMDAQKKGKDTFEVRGINDVERQAIVSKIVEKIGVSPDEAQAAFDVIKDGIDRAVKDAASDTLQNLVMEEARERRVNETMKNGRQLFVGLGKFNKELAFKETDASKFWNDDGSLNEKHPEAKKFSEKVLPIMQTLSKAKISYEQLINISKEFGEEAVYMLAAKKHGLPVAINTEARDKKIVDSEIRKKLSVFMKGNSVSELQTKGGAAATNHKNDATIVKHGYDITRLATDEKYYEKALTAKGGNQGHMDLIEQLVEEGKEYLERKQKTKK